MEKLIKNVDPESWEELKHEATRHRLRLGPFLRYLIKEHKRVEHGRGNAWQHLLGKEKSLSNAEADAIQKSISTFEEEFDFEP